MNVSKFIYDIATSKPPNMNIEKHKNQSSFRLLISFQLTVNHTKNLLLKTNIVKYFLKGKMLFKWAQKKKKRTMQKHPKANAR